MSQRRKKDSERDLERLAFLEDLTRKSVQGSGGGRPAYGPIRVAQGPVIARYARFRHVAGVILGLALGAVLCGGVAVVLEVVALVAEDVSFLGGMARIIGWGLATIAVYGILKSLGEALLLWSDLAELYNSEVERMHRAGHGPYKPR